jgi:hypothetical protein
MKHFAFTFAVAAVLVVATHRSASAEMIAGVSLDAQAVVDAFNSMNDGQGALFQGRRETPNNMFATDFDNFVGDAPDFGAYQVGKFVSFVYSDGGLYGYDAVGTLRYEEGKTTMRHNVALSVGSAYLSRVLATTIDPQWNWEGDYDDLPEKYYDFSNALDSLLLWSFSDDTYLPWPGLDWGINSYLQMLLDANDDQSYWTSLYDPDAYYEEIGNYSVFILDAVAIPNDFFEGHLMYVAEAANPYNPGAPVTPEPATMLMFGMGMLALPFARRLRKKG